MTFRGAIFIVVTTSFTGFAGPVSASGETPAPVDFVYFAQEAQDEINVPFGALGSCKQSGLSIFPLEGVLIADVRVDGRQVERLRLSKSYPHPSQALLVKHPGANFVYTMNLADLSWIDPGLKEGATFKVPKGALPNRIEITYQIRCADGTLAGPFRTVGEKYSLPSPTSGVPPSRTPVR
jgi:hypothetical protein